MRVATAVLTFGILLLGACGSDDGDPERYAVWLVPDALWNVESCDALDPQCPEGTFCAVVWTQTGDTEPLCVDDAICEAVTCDGDGECVVAESFPAQIFCSGNCTGPNCDHPVP